MLLPPSGDRRAISYYSIIQRAIEVISRPLKLHIDTHLLWVAEDRQGQGDQPMD